MNYHFSDLWDAARREAALKLLLYGTVEGASVYFSLRAIIMNYKRITIIMRGLQNYQLLVVFGDATFQASLELGPETDILVCIIFML